MIRTGLLGGSFNPGHLGHRSITELAGAALGLEESWWLVSPGNPLKDPEAMAPLEARFASAAKAAEGLAIKVTAIEREFGTVYTVDTLAELRGRFAERRFIWLMGADNLSQFHRWRDWKRIAELVPIAVVSRPGYDAAAQSAPAMGWLRDFVRPADQALNWTEWRTPALVLLNLPPDRTSSTALRAAQPDWHQKTAKSFNPEALRDGVTRRPLQ